VTETDRRGGGITAAGIEEAAARMGRPELRAADGRKNRSGDPDGKDGRRGREDENPVV